jgi:hypothetical protein
MSSRLRRHAHGSLIILDEETRYALKLAQRERRSIVVAWVAVFLLGLIFWAGVMGILL